MALNNNRETMNIPLEDVESEHANSIYPKSDGSVVKSSFEQLSQFVHGLQ